MNSKSMSAPLERLRHHVTGAIERGEAVAIVEQAAPRTLTRAEAHDTIEAAEQMGALGHLAVAWDMPGHWNEHAEWDAADFYALVDESAVDGDHVRSYGPSDSDATCLPEWEGAL